MTSPSEPLIAVLATFVDVCRRGVPSDIERDAIGRVLDVVGNAIAARSDPVALAAQTLCDAQGGAGRSTSLGSLGSYPASSAALLNGTLAHALDFDDTHMRSILHPSASVVPAALAIAEDVAADGPALLAAIAAGLEVAVRLGDAAVAGHDSLFFDRGFHATAICGAVGAAAAAACVMGLEVASVGHAMAIATSLGSGILESNRTGGSVKRLHCGWAAHAGVMAAQFAAAGVTGPPTALEGRFGFFNSHVGDQWNRDRIEDELGVRWEASSSAYKPYPTNHFTHAVIDGAISLRGLVQANEIQEVHVGVPAATLRTIAEPVATKATPTSGYASKFSGPFTFAAAFLGGGGLGVYLSDFTEQTISDPARLDLAGRIRFHADSEATEAFPERFGAVIAIRTRSGGSHEVRIRSSRGGPGNPLQPAELRQKFELNVGHAGFSTAQASAIASSIESLNFTSPREVFADVHAVLSGASAS